MAPSIKNTRSGSYSSPKPTNPFNTSNPQTASQTHSISKNKPSMKVPEFVFFKDIIKNEKEGPSFCEAHNDPYVSYCTNCKKPMCVKCLLAHAKKHELHDVKSLHELRNMLGNNIGGTLSRLISREHHGFTEEKCGAVGEISPEFIIKLKN